MKDLIFSILLVILLTLYIYLSKSNKTKNKNLPPSPPSLPIIGHLHLLKSPLHETIHKISSNYGQILLLNLGFRKLLIVSSPKSIHECLVKNDSIFSDRPPNTLAGRILHYDNTTIAFSPYNNYYRTLKRLLTQEVFSSSKIPALSSIRVDECRLLLRELWCATTDDSRKRVRVDLNRGFTDFALNVMTRISAGKRYYGKDVEDPSQAKEFTEILKEGAKLSGFIHPMDFLPMLRFLFRGLEKDMLSWMEKAGQFYQKLLDERKKITNKVDTKCVIDVLIDAQQQDPMLYTNQVIKGTIMVLILGGADPAASTMEFAMSLLLNNPEAMKKAYAEIDTIVGSDRLMNEDDISKLPYLQNIINETLRLYPPTPLLFPHQSTDDSTICEYHVPRGTMLLVSLWTIHRDPKLWTEPERFIPERFQGKGEDNLNKLFPFGLGRRTCPGYAMSKRAICLVIGSLIQCFEWERTNEELVDMSLYSGLNIHKQKPLESLCRVRPCMTHLLAKHFNV